jgi:hypothetical protein
VGVLKIHTSDGQTHPVDLADPEQAKEWLARLRREDFQASSQGVSLVERHLVRGKCRDCGSEQLSRELGVQYSISRPSNMQRVSMHVEAVEAQGRVHGGERVTLFADDVCLTLMAHAGQPASRVTISKVGKQTFNALRRIGNRDHENA